MSATRGESTTFAKRCLASLESLFKQQKLKYQPLVQSESSKLTSLEQTTVTCSDANALDKQQNNLVVEGTLDNGGRRSSQDAISVASTTELRSGDSSPTSNITGRASSSSASSQTQGQNVTKESSLRQSMKRSEAKQSEAIQRNAEAVCAPAAAATATAPALSPPSMQTCVPPPQVFRTTTPVKSSQQIRKPRPNLLPSGFELQPTVASGLARRRAESRSPLLV